MYTTVVPASLEGRGVAKLLADKAFDFAVKEQVGWWIVMIEVNQTMDQIYPQLQCGPDSPY